MDLSWETGGLSPSELNFACRLVFAYQHCPHALDNPEGLREMAGLPAPLQAKLLGVARGIIEGLQDRAAKGGLDLPEPL